MSHHPATQGSPTLADHFWTLAKQVGQNDEPDPVHVVQRFLVVLRSFAEHGGDSSEMTRQTRSLLMLLRRQEVEGDLTYASPEQARGEPVDERSLVFSVGVLLFEKLTGRHPFGAEATPTRVDRIRRGEIASGVNYFPKIPGELRVIVVRAIAAFPEERWNNLADLGLQLEAFMRYATVPKTKPLTTPKRRLPALPSHRPHNHNHNHEVAPAIGPDPTGLDHRFDDRDAPTLEEPTLERFRKSPWIARAGWMSAGVLLSSGVFLAILGGSLPGSAPADGAAHKSSVPTQEAPAPQGAQAALPESVTAEVPPSQPTPAEGSPAATDDSASEPDIEIHESSTVFAPLRSAQTLADESASCLTPLRRKRGPHYFGATLVYSPKSSSPKNVFMGGSKSITANEKRCIKRSLLASSEGAPPGRDTTVVLNFAVRSDLVKVKAKLK